MFFSFLFFSVEHVQMLAIALCKMLRPVSSPNASSTSIGDLSLSVTSSSASAAPLVIDADESR